MSDRRKAIAYLVAANPQRKGRQRSTIQRFADTHDIELVAEYLDDSDTRRGLGGALMALRDGVAKIVLIARAEHLGPAMVEQQVIIGLLGLRGAKVFECATEECLSETDSEQEQLIHEAVAIAEKLRKQTIVGRLVEAGKSGAKRGPKPYGTRPNEKPVVDLIMTLRTEKSWGVRRIANELNRRGIVNRAGGKWIPSGVQRVFNHFE